MKRIVAVLAVAMLALIILPGLLVGAHTSNTRSNAASRAALQPAVTVAVAPGSSPTGPTAGSLASDPDRTLVERLQAASGPVQVAAHLRTGRARFMGPDADRPGFHGIATGISGQPEAAARAFLDQYGSLFGVADSDTMAVMKQNTEAAGAGSRTYVRFQQTLSAIPVMGGELIVQVDGAGRVWSVSGETLPEETAGQLATEPVIRAEAAAATALVATVKYEAAPADSLTVSAPQLWYYASDLLGAPGPVLNRLVWRVEVAAKDLAPIRELVLVDALTGKVALRFNQVPDAKSRTVFNNNNNRNAGLPGSGPVRTEGQAPTGNGDVDKAYDYAGDTYEFYMNRHSRDSIDDAGMAIISTVKYCPSNLSTDCPYPNAFWNGAQMVYGDGYASGDDVVGHELTHGVTDFESQLYYYMQSGALNESLSDIWGEYIDQSNAKGNDGPSVRWQMGEDIPIGAIRNMSNPGLFDDPDSIGSLNYKCDTLDSGAVHSNSGVSNKAAVLMTDGGSLNGKTVTALGLDKSVQIWYRMATRLITSGSEYQDVADVLPQACMDLVAAGTAGITTADCHQVENAVAATQMDQQPAACASIEAPVCSVGQTATDVYNEDFENQPLSLSRWTSSSDGGPKPWYYPQTDNPYGITDFHYASSGLYHLWGDDLDVASDGWMEMKNPVAVPTTGQPYFRFRHAFGFESDIFGNYDAGVVEYSADGGPWTDAGPLFVDNGYNGLIDGNPSNPLYGGDGFVSVSWGYGSSRLDLGTLKGYMVRFRFRVASDEQIADYGWFVDDVRLYTCDAAPVDTPTPTATVTTAATASPTASRTPNPNLTRELFMPVILR